MGRIAKKKAAGSIKKYAIIVAIAIAVVYFAKGYFSKSEVDPAESTTETISVDVKPGQGFEMNRTLENNELTDSSFVTENSETEESLEEE